MDYYLRMVDVYLMAGTRWHDGCKARKMGSKWGILLHPSDYEAPIYRLHEQFPDPRTYLIQCRYAAVGDGLAYSAIPLHNEYTPQLDVVLIRTGGEVEVHRVWAAEDTLRVVTMHDDTVWTGPLSQVEMQFSRAHRKAAELAHEFLIRPTSYFVT